MNTPSEHAVLMPYKDRRTGLVFFGILVVLLGGLCLLLILFLLLGQAMQARVTGTGPSFRVVVPAVATYGMLAGVFVWLGIGSILARRWARALLLILSWSWLAVGIFSLAFTLVLLPRVLASGPGQGLPPGAAGAVMAVAFAVSFVMFVVVPGTLLLFYRSPQVRATCEARDPAPCWTDACPLPVLGMALWLGLGALSLLLVPVAYNGVLPCFGMLVHGLPGGALSLGLAAIWAYLAWASYRLRPRAWWLTTGLLCCFAVSGWITFMRVDLMEMYRLMGYPEAQLEQLRRLSFISGPSFAWWSLAALLPMLGYLVWIKRFFHRSP